MTPGRSPCRSPSSVFKTQEVFLLGLVDVLQTYSIKRRLETLVKSGVYQLEGQDPGAISIVDPETYAARFLTYLDQHTA